MRHFPSYSHLRRSKLAALALTALVVACSDDPSGSVIERVAVEPGTLQLIEGDDTTVTARAWTTDRTVDTERRVFWASSDPTIVTVSPTGIVTAISTGSARVAASAGGKSGIVQVTVVPEPIVLVRVTPPASGVGVGASLTLRADAIAASGDTVVGRAPTWRTSRATVASVTAAGAVTGVTTGTADIIATIGGISGSAVISVQPASVASVAVTPATATQFVGRSVQLSTTLKAADSTVLTGRFVTWTSSNAAVATVSSTGLVTGLGAGTATLTATSEGKRGTARVTVSLVPVARVDIVPNPATVSVGNAATLVALPRDSTGALLGGRTITWTTSAPAVATVSASGVVTGIALGTAVITGATGGRSGTAAVTVTQVPVARVTVTPAAATIGIGAVQQLTAATLDAAGRTLSGRVVTWLSGAPSIARVDTQGRVTAVGRGTVLIFAESEGKRAQSSITVR